jgi:hypothetical protein
VGILGDLSPRGLRANSDSIKTPSLGIAGGSLHNYLNGVRRIPDNVDYKEV